MPKPSITFPKAATKAGILWKTQEKISTLTVPPDITLESPLEIHISSDADLEITIGERSRVTLNIHAESAEENFACSIQVHIKQEAICEIIFLENASAKTVCTLKQDSKIEEGAQLHWFNMTLGGETVDQTLENSLVGKNAESTVDWIFYAQHKERFTLSAINKFENTEGGGEITMKGVAEEKAHIQAKGMIEIGINGGGTKTYLTQDVLMLDPRAKVDAIPGLEIKTNDVKASHSATVSRVTAEDLFYFAARGIEIKEARSMYVQGFLGDLIGKLSDADLRREVATQIAGKYGK